MIDSEYSINEVLCDDY